MNVRSSHFTLELEDVLRFMARQSRLPIAYCARRYDVEKEKVVAWLAEFNAGQRPLTEKRIDEVLRELGAGKAEAPKAVRPAAAAVKTAPVAPATPPPAKPALAAPGADIGRWLEEQRAKITARVTSFQVEVTPAMATAWLGFNTGNRSPSKMKIRRFAAAMKAGRWSLNGESLKFSANGRLLDGQSRLMAIELAAVPVVLEVRAGLPDAAQQSMDVGEVRKNAHTLEMLGENYPNMLAPSLKLCWLLERGQLGGAKFKDSPVMENYEVQPMLQRHAALKRSIGWVVSDGHKVKRLLRQSEAAFFHYIFGTISFERRDFFFDGLVDGIGLAKTNAVYHLREKLLGGEIPRVGEPNAILRRALMIKAWNHLQAGESVSMLRLLPAERFPSISGLVAQTVEKEAAA